MADDNLSSQLVDSVTANTVDLMRVSTGMTDKILAMLKDLEAELVQKIERNTDPNGLSAMRLRTLLAQTRDTIRSAYGDVSNSHLKDLQGVAKATAISVRNAVNENVGVNLFSVAFTREQLETLARRTMIDGAFSAEWWRKQDVDLQHRFTQQMRLGMLQGESVGDLTRRVRGTREAGFTDGIMQVPYNQAETLVRTSVLSIANMTRLESYMQNKDLIQAIQWVSTLDDRTTEICIALDGLTWSLPSNDAADFGAYTPLDHDKEFPGPTAHWNCRSTQIPVLYSFKEIAGPKAWKLPDGDRADLADLFQEKLQNKGFTAEEARAIEADTRASMDGQVAQTLGFQGWLESKPEAFQDELLGKATAELWRQGAVALSDLTTQANRPLSVAELQAKASGATLPPPLVSPEAETAVAALEDIHVTEQESMDNLRAAILNDFEQEQIKLEALRREVDAFFPKFDDMQQRGVKLSSEEYQSVHAEFKKVQAARNEVLDGRENALARTRQRLEVPEHDRSVTKTTSLTNDNRRRVAFETGRDVLDRIAVASIKGADSVRLDATMLDRSFYDHYDRPNTVFMSAQATDRTALHELGHWIESHHPETLQRLLAFRDTRTMGMPLEPLGKLMNHPDYEGEFAYRAAPAYPSWLDPYTGKHYYHGTLERYATEILSKSLEYYWYEPAKLIRQDPELFDFIYRVLRDKDPLPHP